jgi:hypothetical protein
MRSSTGGCAFAWAAMAIQHPPGDDGEASTLKAAPRGVSSAGRAPALQAGGHRFDPGTLHRSTRRKQPVSGPLLDRSCQRFVSLNWPKARDAAFKPRISRADVLVDGSRPLPGRRDVRRVPLHGSAALHPLEEPGTRDQSGRATLAAAQDHSVRAAVRVRCYGSGPRAEMVGVRNGRSLARTRCRGEPGQTADR